MLQDRRVSRSLSLAKGSAWFPKRGRKSKAWFRLDDNKSNTSQQKLREIDISRPSNSQALEEPYAEWTSHAQQYAAVLLLLSHRSVYLLAFDRKAVPPVPPFGPGSLCIAKERKQLFGAVAKVMCRSAHKPGSLCVAPERKRQRLELSHVV